MSTLPHDVASLVDHPWRFALCYCMFLLKVRTFALYAFYHYPVFKEQNNCFSNLEGYRPGNVL
ncbi:hypothetical protein, partial [Brevibacillus laterosporus]|uniref:hypothetical protein n=1 Tax=Brevibacillus laterosporus TaxID=1465 RepID=UPI001C3C27B8